MSLRPLTKEDTDIVHAIEKLCFESVEVYSRSTVETLCTTHNGFIDSSNRGYILFSEIKSDVSWLSTVPTIVSIGVNPAYRRQGVAQALIAAVLQHYNCKCVYLHVRTKNISARKLYEKLGFTYLAILPSYYNITCVKDDAYYMTRIPPCRSKLTDDHTWKLVAV